MLLLKIKQEKFFSKSFGKISVAYSQNQETKYFLQKLKVKKNKDYRQSKIC